MSEPTPTQEPNLLFRRFSGAQAREIRLTVQEIYENSYVEAIATGDPFRTPDEFMRRFDSYTSPDNPGFEMVLGCLADHPVGQCWGWSLASENRWWTGVELDQPDDSFTVEDGKRTFAFSELMVRTESAGRGIGRKLHEELLSRRPEQRATLLVNPPNTRAYSTYIRWGWYRVGTLRPHWSGAPRFHVLIHDLPLYQDSTI